jgi:RND family efflux transporter MFP subunit
MNKNPFFIFVLPILALILSACSGNSTETAIPTVVLSNANAGNPPAASGGIRASGQVVPVQHVQLSFPLTGTAKTVAVQAGDSVTAGQTLITLDAGLLQAKVAEAQADLDQATAHLHYLVRIGSAQETLDSAQADVDRAQALLDSAKATLAEATLTAPFNGTIAEVDLSPAETVVPGQAVILLGDLTRFQVETTDLSERDVPNVKVGQAVKVTLPDLNQVVSGKVSEVARVSTTVGGDVVYKVVVQLDQQPAGLMWGMTATISIQTGN